MRPAAPAPRLCPTMVHGVYTSPTSRTPEAPGRLAGRGVWAVEGAGVLVAEVLGFLASAGGCQRLWGQRGGGFLRRLHKLGTWRGGRGRERRAVL